MSSIEVKNFDNPDESNTSFNNAKMDIVKVGDQRVMRLTLQPGWKWPPGFVESNLGYMTLDSIPKPTPMKATMDEKIYWFQPLAMASLQRLQELRYLQELPCISFCKHFSKVVSCAFFAAIQCSCDSICS